MNFVKTKLYSFFSKIYPPELDSRILNGIARILFKIFGYATVDYGQIKLKVTPNDMVDRFILLNRHINPFVTSAVSQVLADGGVFLDMGANHAVLSLLAARNDKVKVFAFEPSPRELQRLFMNLALNGKNNISVLSYGLGEAEITQDFNLGDDDHSGCNSLPNILDGETRVSCHFATLTGLLSPELIKQARVCKVDVEGQEMFVFKSLKSHMDLMRQCVFVVEVSDHLLKKIGFKSDDIYSFFADAGFKHQYVNDPKLVQWEEIFYHPDFNQEIAFSPSI